MLKKVESVSCEECHSRNNSLFKDLSDDHLCTISENKTCTKYKKGQVIFYEGTRPLGLFCVNEGKIKIYKDILQSKNQILLNRELMQLDDVDISGNIKMKTLDRFNEPIEPLHKMNFMKILLKYKVIGNFGDINDWLKTTFGNLIIK